MKLIVNIKSGTLMGRTFELVTGHLTIGRSDHCSIRFDPLQEKIASKQHAFIEARPDGFYLTDNNSTNGTYVNGQRVATIRLNPGDTIQFGTRGVTAEVVIEQGAPAADTSGMPTLHAAALDQTAGGISTVSPPGAGEVYRTRNVGFRDSVSSLGLSNVRVEPERNNTGKYIGIAVTLFAIVFLGLIVSGIMLLSLGPVAAVLAAVIAFVPAIFYLFPFIWLDRYDPEPIWLLALAFAWGALVSVILSFVINTVIGVGMREAFNPTVGVLAGALFSAPVFEELTKGAGILIIVLFFRKYFDGILDGIIFAGVIALGFATVENVLYYGSAWLEYGFVDEQGGGLIATFIGRGILSPFAHATFTAMIGIGFGISRESHNKAVKIIMPIIGYLAAVCLHFFWNTIAILFGAGFLLFYVFIELPFFILFVIFAFWIMWRQNRIIREMLAIDVARGLIPQDHFERATSAFKSTWWLITSLFKGKFRATSRYIKAIGKLGLSYWHIQRATVAQGQTASFQQNPVLREEVLRWRDQV